MDNKIPGTIPAYSLFQDLLEDTSKLHKHLCPRQVLGVRLGIRGLISLGLREPGFTERFMNKSKRLLVIAETDGCGMDGIAVAASCTVGRRTIRVVDYGKVAATFIDTDTGQTVRIAPSSRSRELAWDFAPEATTSWQSYLIGYQRIPDELLFSEQLVVLNKNLGQLLGQPGVRTECQQCGEEIMNSREVTVRGQALCLSCAGESYYQVSCDLRNHSL